MSLSEKEKKKRKIYKNIHKRSRYWNYETDFKAAVINTFK